MSTQFSKKNSLFINEFSEIPFNFLQNISTEKVKYWKPRINLKSTKNEYILTADLPGCETKNVHVTLKDNILTIKGEHIIDEKNEFYFHERQSGFFERSVYLYEKTIEQNTIDKKLHNGFLIVIIEKATESKQVRT